MRAKLRGEQTGVHQLQHNHRLYKQSVKILQLVKRTAFFCCSPSISENFAKRHPVFSKTVCVRTADLYQWAEWKARALALRAAGRANTWTQRPPAPLSPDQAREVGANLLGEIILFTLGASILIFELSRLEARKEAKEMEERNAWLGLLTLLKETGVELERQQTHINELRAVLDETIREIEEGKADKQKGDGPIGETG